MESIFGTESEDLLLTVKNALRKESIKEHDKLEIMLEDAFLR